MQKRSVALFFVLSAILLVLCFWKLETIPPPDWDEGWNLSVARNWVELGHYGQLLEDEPRSKGLAGYFSVIAPVALSFKLFGVGIWQARLPAVLFTLSAFVLVYYLAAQLYNRTVAWGAMGVLLLMTGGLIYNPILVGRQALGEIPALFYLLAGYSFLLLALRGSGWFVLPGALLLGIALRTKAQILPFWLISLLFPLVVAVIKRWWRPALLLATGLVGSWIASGLVVQLQKLILGDRMIPGEPL